jgi:hypothetical protein
MERTSALRIVALCAIAVFGFACLAFLTSAAQAQERLGPVQTQLAAGHDQAGMADEGDCGGEKPTRCCSSQFSSTHAIPVDETPRVLLTAAARGGAWARDLSLVGLKPSPEPTPPRRA